MKKKKKPIIFEANIFGTKYGVTTVYIINAEKVLVREKANHPSYFLRRSKFKEIL